MTQFELVEADFKAKSAVIEAERSNLKTQIGVLEAQIQQTRVKEMDLQMQWNNYLQSIKEQAQANTEPEAEAPAKGKAKK